jgi:PTH1 family peptidyl-tRNA hydrolase
VGRYRFRAKGSAGGHNGLKSIESHLQTQEYGRLRIGVGPAEPERQIGVLRDYVLGTFGKLEAEEIRALLPTLVEGIELWLREGMGPTMNRFPGKRATESD